MAKEAVNAAEEFSLHVSATPRVDQRLLDLVHLLYIAAARMN